MEKWQYEIMVQMKDGTEYVVWTYSKHFDNDIKLTRKGKKMYGDAQTLFGVSHSKTAMSWVVGLKNSLLKENEKGNYDVDIMKDGLFNPHYRRGDMEEIWIKPIDIREVYFKMHLLNKGEYPS